MNARKVCLGLGLLMAAGAALAQVDTVWTRCYDLDGDTQTGNDMIHCQDGGLAIAGSNTRAEEDQTDFLLVRINDEGEPLWIRTYDLDAQDIAYSIIQTDDGGFILAGYNCNSFEDFYGFRIALLRVDREGERSWARVFESDHMQYCSSIIQVEEDRFVLTGQEILEEGIRGLLVYISGAGEVIFLRNFGSGHAKYFAESINSDDDNILSIGSAYYSARWSTGYIWLVSSDPNGEQLWDQRYGTPNERYFGQSLLRTTDGCLAILGVSSPHEGLDDAILMKVNSQGDFLWLKQFGEAYGNDWGASILEQPDGGLIVGGSSESYGAGESDFWLLRTDANGDSIWSTTFGGEFRETGGRILTTVDGGYMIAGATQSFGVTGSDVYIVKTTPDPVSVGSSDPLYPSSLILYPSFPNPFNSTVTISFDKPVQSVQSVVNLSIFDPLGRRVAELIPNGKWKMENGTRQSVVWNAAGFPAGGYIVRLESGGISLEQPIILAK